MIMLNRRGQANIIVMVGMVAAVIFVLFNAFNYMNTVGLSSQIELSAQNSIYQTLGIKDYLVQQANYLFDEAQLFDAFSLTPTTTNCGYINASTELPFIPVSKVYYWHNLAGQTCLPNNQEILYGLMQLLNSTQFSMINSSGLNIQSFLSLNLSKTDVAGVFVGNFTAPYLDNVNYTFYYYKSNATNTSLRVFDKAHNQMVFNGTVGSTINLNGSQFTVFSESDIVRGVFSQPVSTSSFFKGQSGLSPDAQFTLATLQDGTMAVLYDTKSFNPQTGVQTQEFFLTPLSDQSAYTLNRAKISDIQAGLPPSIELYNNTAFKYEGTWYTFTVGSYPNGIFSISPQNYTVIPLQPNFVYYKYLINQFQMAQNENLLFPSYQPLYVSLSLFPIYNPEVCVSYNKIQFTLTNCISVSSYITSTDYISQLMKIGAAFVNQSFPLGNFNITGFAQYALYNYLNNVVQGVNLKTVSVNGQPKYDWYSALILALGSPQNGANYLINQLSRVKENYLGTTVYNCSQSQSDMSFCRSLLSQTIQSDLNNLLQYQVPLEVSFLSAMPFNVNVLNLSVAANEANYCPSYGGYGAADYNASVNYSFSITPPDYHNMSVETITAPISLNFAYQNKLSLTPTESCGMQNNPYEQGYPGFSLVLANATNTYFNCAPIISKPLLNNTCIASVETSSSTEKSYISSNGGTCSSVTGQSYYFCSGYKFNAFSSAFPYPYQRWITKNNACPNYAVIDGQNFTYTQNPTQYKLISMYGGGAVSYKDTSVNWTFAAINGSTLNLPANFSVHVGATIGGPAPAFNLILSSNPRLSSQATVFQLNSGDTGNGIYNYTEANGLIQLAGSSYSATAGVENNIIVQKFGSLNGGYNITFSSNGVQQAKLNLDTAEGLGILTNPIKFLGFSTDYEPSFDTVDYAFVTNYAYGYNPVTQIGAYEPASSLNTNLLQAFALTTSSDTYYNLITMNPASFSNSYQLQLVLDTNFNYAYLTPHFIKIFGVSSSGNIAQLAWWNQSALQSGGILWINLSKYVPQALYVVYGTGAYDNSAYSDNANSVFPVFFSPSAITFTYSQYASTIPYTQNGNLYLTRVGPVPPYIYNSTLNTLYSQFACVTVKPSLAITMINASYSPYEPQFNINNLYNSYNALYPSLQILWASKTYSSWATVGT